MDDVRRTIAVANQQAMALHEQGKASEAAALAASAYAAARVHLPADDELRKSLRMNAAALAELAGNGEDALRLYAEAAQAADAIGDVPTLGQALDRLFAIHRQRGEAEDAVRAGERSLALWRARREPPNDVVLSFMNNLAEMHYRAGNAEAAGALMEEVIAHRQRLSPGDTPALALALLNLGTVRASHGDLVSAESHKLSALAMRRRLFPPGDPEIRDALQQVSALYESHDDFQKAIPYGEESLAAARRAGSGGRDLALELNNVATLYYRAGDVARSRPLYEEALAIVTRVNGKQHPDTAVAMGNLANVLRQMGDFDGAERLLREVLATRRALLGDTHGHVATAIDDLTDLFSAKRSASDLEKSYRDLFAMVLSQFEDAGSSTPELLRSLRKIERARAALEPDRPRSLAQIESERRKGQPSSRPLAVAKLLFYLEEGALAATLFAEARAGVAQQTVTWSLATTGLAASLAQAHDLAQAERTCDEYIACVHAGWQAPAGDYAAVLRTKSQVTEAMHGPKAAVATMRESVAQGERAQSDGGFQYASNLLRLSELCLDAGDLEVAADVARRLLEQPPATIQTATAARARAVLAQVARRDGRIVEAESLFRAALKPLLEIEPTWRTALVLRNFGEMHTESGDAEDGVPLIQRAAGIAETLFGKRSWQHAMMLATLAEVRCAWGPVHEAAPLFVEVADIAKELDSPELLARALRGSGALYTKIAASEAAEAMLTGALTTLKQHSALPVTIASIEVDLAMTEARLKKYDGARARIDRAITTLQGAGERRTELANAISTRMWILGRMERWDEAFVDARATSDALEESLLRPLTVASASARDRLASALYEQLDIVLSLAVRLRTPAAIADACERTLRWKGAALTWGASQVQALAGSTAVEVTSLRRDLIDVRREIIKRLISGPGSVQEGSVPMAELQRREEALDREIARQLSLVQGASALPTGHIVTIETVIAALPAGAALIDYVRYESIDFERGSPADRFHPGTHRYAAFVVRAGAEPALFDVGDAEAIDRAVGRFRSAITGEADPGGIPPQGPWADDHGTRPASSDTAARLDDDWTAAGAELRRMIFDPLRDAIGACTRLSIAQHGELTRVPFAALPFEHECLIDGYELTSLDTGRDLLRGDRDVTVPGDALVMADPDFDLALESVSPMARQRPFGSLMGTREEALAVASILDVTAVLGGDATESRLRSARSPRILHVATHGFFLADDRPPLPVNVVDSISVVDIPGYGRYAVQAFDKPRDIDDGPAVDRLRRMGRLPDPLLRSGIALAGSNTWVSGRSLPEGDDGLLTAAEIALFDFTSTDLAVLSACETGLGEVRRGEGIFGLRRAFAIAGARTLVMSLWKIPDAQTRDLMIEFYRRATAGESSAQALRSAQLSVRQTIPHPMAWAGMICIGKPSTLRHGGLASS